MAWATPWTSRTWTVKTSEAMRVGPSEQSSHLAQFRMVHTWLASKEVMIVRLSVVGVGVMVEIWAGEESNWDFWPEGDVFTLTTI